ncbi:MAG TPA: hypothetical protein VLY03_04340 [Bacteroidota bacterium]|nr:hypothetical protein [Bacteroidota bacterium]
MELIKKLGRIFLPKPLRASLQARYREVIFRSAMKSFMKDPSAAIRGDRRILTRLIYGWGNEGWSALEEYLTASLQRVSTCRGAILECGSGLSTILAGIVAQQAGNSIWSLEHNRTWGDRVRKCLELYGIRSVLLLDAPLRDYGKFSWYDVQTEQLPEEFSVILCDGPPGETRGGRYGLVPVMGTHIKGGTVILLDDAGRADEQSIAACWEKELNATVRRIGEQKPYFEIVVP